MILRTPETNDVPDSHRLMLSRAARRCKPFTLLTDKQHVLYEKVLVLFIFLLS